jgi:hypothetical protein
MKKLDNQRIVKSVISLVFIAVFILLFHPLLAHAYVPPPAVNPQNTAVGLTGTISSPPPSVAATIDIPLNGQVFTTLPIQVQGICQSGLLIKLYINGVFVGAAQCVNSSYSITTALFNGINNLVVEDFDSLNQEGPPSNTVTVTFNNPNVGAGVGITLTSNYAKLGVSPGSTMSWPIIVSGGDPPYAVSIDWGDGKPAQLLSEANPGTFNISHVYSNSGIYTILIKVTDTQGNLAYLQLVGVANGPAAQASSTTKLNSSSNSPTKSKISDKTLFILIALIIAALLSTFWLGSKHKLASIKRKLENGEELK